MCIYKCNIETDRLLMDITHACAQHHATKPVIVYMCTEKKHVGKLLYTHVAISIFSITEQERIQTSGFLRNGPYNES